MSKIIVDHLSKEFRLQQDRAHSIKELITRRGRDRSKDHFWALRDVSFEIPEGSMFALVGHNGSGKSTLLRCVAGIYRPDGGSVTVDGRISTLLELGAGFHPDLSGRENVYLNATILGMTKKQIDREFDAIVHFAGVEQFIDSPVKVYSSGMYVRLGFSVAVHVQPEILIIDEVIAVGDEAFQRKCFDHLYGLRKQGTTIVVVTHGLGIVETMCDGAAWLDHGVLQMVGAAGEVANAYLQRVNDQEADDRASEASTARHEPIEPGLGKEIRITDVYFTDQHGQATTTGMTGAELRVHIAYDADEPVEDPVFGVLVHAENGVHVTGTNTKLDGHRTGVLHGKGEVVMVLDELPLQPGHFELSVGINDKFVQHVYDRHDRAYELVVRRGDEPPAAGFFRLRAAWSVNGTALPAETTGGSKT
jgi:lipopolysaccharide transport system ATP-binding protein